MTIPMHDAFAFWEADVHGEAELVQAPVCSALALALELQTADWTEDEAGAELARRCDSRSLHTAQQTLLAAFQQTPEVLVRAICASRALWVAMDIVDAPPAQPPQRPASRLRRWTLGRRSAR